MDMDMEDGNFINAKIRDPRCGHLLDKGWRIQSVEPAGSPDLPLVKTGWSQVISPQIMNALGQQVVSNEP